MKIINNDNPIIQADGIEFTNGEKNPTPLPETQNENIRIRELNDFVTFEKEIIVRDTDATDADKYPVFYTAMQPCFLIEARIRHEVNSSSGTVDIEKLSSGTKQRNGDSMLEAKFDISSKAGMVQKVGPTIVLAGTQLVPGDSMALKPGGTLTGASSVFVGVLMGMLTKDMPEGQNQTTILVGV